MANMETPLPGLDKDPEMLEEFDVMDGSLEDMPELDTMGAGGAAGGMPKMKATPELQEAQGKFMQALTQVMAQLSEPCQEQFSQAMQGQTSESMTEECQQEFQKVVSTIPDYSKMQEQYIQAQADAVRRANGRQPDPNTPYYLGATLVLLLVGVVGYVLYVNQKLKEAGLLDRKPKQLSKKKLEKERAKASRKTK